MKIAVDKNSLNNVNNDNEFIYLFDDDENFEDLLKTKLHCIRYDLCKFVDINLTDYEIDCIKKAKPTDKNWDKLPEKVDYKIGIIIPNFNYEHTIDKCLNSIFNQTYTNYEIIFVDDMSTDNSVEIAKKLYEEKLLSNDEFGYLKIVKLKQKRYNGGARNEGYLHLSDDVDYIFCIDSDDWLLNDDVLKKINYSLQTKPDVLFIGLSDYKNGRTKKCFVPEYKDKYEAMQGWSGVGKIIKKSLATKQECLYNEGTLKEDRNQHYKICINMNSFKLLKEPLYVWNKSNMKSVTTIRDDVIWGTSTIRHYADTMQLYLTYKGQDSKLDNILKSRVLKTKQEMENGGDQQW